MPPPCFLVLDLSLEGHVAARQQHRLGRLPLTAEDLVLSRRLTEGRSGTSAREAHVQLALVNRGISIRTLPGFRAWAAPVGKAREERHEVTERGRIVPRNGWMLFFESPDQPQRIALLGRSS